VTSALVKGESKLRVFREVLRHSLPGSYRDLRVQRRSLKLALDIYAATQNFPRQEHYGLVSQMRASSRVDTEQYRRRKRAAHDRDRAHSFAQARSFSPCTGIPDPNRYKAELHNERDCRARAAPLTPDWQDVEFAGWIDQAEKW